MVKLIKLKKLQKLNSCHAWLPRSPPPPPLLHTHCTYVHYTMGRLYLNLFLGSELYLLTQHKRQVEQENHGNPSKSLCGQRDCSKLYKMTEWQCFKLRGKRLVKKAYAKIERKYISSTPALFRRWQSWRIKVLDKLRRQPTRSDSWYVAPKV